MEGLSLTHNQDGGLHLEVGFGWSPEKLGRHKKDRKNGKAFEVESYWGTGLKVGRVRVLCSFRGVV